MYINILIWFQVYELPATSLNNSKGESTNTTNPEDPAMPQGGVEGDSASDQEEVITIMPNVADLNSTVLETTESPTSNSDAANRTTRLVDFTCTLIC